MPNDDYILRSDALKAILGVSIYDTIEELEGARTIAESTWADGLYDAYKIIEEEVDSANVEPVRKWIPVTERLPEILKPVLVWQPIYTNLYIGLWDGTDWWIYGGMGIKEFGITHWKSLPEPPEEDQDEAE